MTIADRYFVTLKANNGLSVRVLTFNNSPLVGGGYGGWEVASRPRRVALTRFAGHQPFTQDLNVIFDGLSDNSSQESDITTLERMAEQPSPLVDPPLIKLSGFALRRDLTYVINSIDWDASTAMWDVQHGVPVRLRQIGTVHLLQYVDETVITTKETPAAQNSASLQTPPKTVSDPGQTVKQIAQEMYGDPSKYYLIFSVNPGIKLAANSDPSYIVKPGTPIKKINEASGLPLGTFQVP